MSPRVRLRLLAAVVAAVILAVGAFLVVEWRRASGETGGESGIAVADPGAFDDGPRIVFRSTAAGERFGRVAVAALDDPAGPRDITGVACDRVDARAGLAVCLRTERGVVPRFTALVLDGDWREVAQWPLAGIPSRARLSSDGALVGTTAFVTGHSYATSGFSTETEIHGLGDPATPEDLGNIEFYRLMVDGAEIAPVDRNLWGVTFVDDSSFYATAQSTALGRTWLVRGDLRAQTLEAVAEGVECPSLSPDGTRIAFKADTDEGRGIHWTPAVLDLGTRRVTVLDGEGASIDDQIAWLDDETILYGRPRTDEAGVTDIWSLETRAGSAPRLFLPEAWSPAVVR